MDRYQINVENLPKSKRDFLLEFLSGKDSKEKKFFLVGLILLGFCSPKDNKMKDNFRSINMSMGGERSEKHRIQISNEKLLDCLNQYETTKEKLSIVYYFLFCGLCKFYDLLKAPEFISKKELDRTEKDLFFCGLSKYIDIGSESICSNAVTKEKSLKKSSQKKINTEEKSSNSSSSIAESNSSSSIAESNSSSSIAESNSSSPITESNSSSSIAESNSSSSIAESNFSSSIAESNSFSSITESNSSNSIAESNSSSDEDEDYLKVMQNMTVDFG